MTKRPWSRGPTDSKYSPPQFTYSMEDSAQSSASLIDGAPRVVPSSLDDRLLSKIDDETPKTKRSLVDITEETEYVKEIKDIQDELNCMKRVFEQQLRLFQSRSARAGGLYSEYVPHNITTRLQKIQELEKEAARVYDAVSHWSLKASQIRSRNMRYGR
jgi:hypothetical protein